MVLGRVEVGARTNGIPLIVDPLASFDLTDGVVTADALHCQRATAEHIVGRGGHYVCTVNVRIPLAPVRADPDVDSLLRSRYYDLAARRHAFRDYGRVDKWLGGNTRGTCGTRLLEFEDYFNRLALSDRSLHVEEGVAPLFVCVSKRGFAVDRHPLES